MDKLKKMMNMRKVMKRFGWLFVFVLVLIAAGVYWKIAQAEKKKPHFDTLKVDRGTIISTVNTTGTLNAVISVDIGSQVSGKITKLYVDYNSHVKKGQVLAQVDPLVYRAQAEEANANLNSARATSVNSKAQYESALAKIRGAQSAMMNSEAQMEVSRANVAGSINNQTSAKANVAKAEAQLVDDKAEYDRSAELIKKDFISHTDMDAAEAKYKVSMASVDLARASFDQATSGVKSAQMQLEAARHNVESAKIDIQSQQALANGVQAQVKQSDAQVVNTTFKLQEAMVNLSYTNIISPIDGVVVLRAIDVGQTVAASFQTPRLFTLARDLKDMEVYANVDEADIGKIANGLKVTFTVDAFAGQNFDGVVKQIRKASIVDQGVVKYQVVISARNPDLKLMPGMTANVTITTEISSDCIRIPNGAIRFRPESVPGFPYTPGSKTEKSGRNNTASGTAKTTRQKTGANAVYNSVWVYESDGKVRQEKALAGITDGLYTEMKKGSIKEGESLIIGVQGSKPKSPAGGGTAGAAASMRMLR